jgi:uncharacterized protein (TIGR02231 family)
MIPTTPKKVTLFEDRAEVIREAPLTLPAGRTLVSLAGVTPFVDDRSVQAKIVASSVKILSARVKRSVSFEDSSQKEALAALEKEALSLRASATTAAKAQDRAQLALQRQQEAFALWCNQLQKSFRAEDAPQWDSAYQDLERSINDALLDLQTKEEDQEKKIEAASRADAQLAVGQKKEQRIDVFIEVELDASEAIETNIEITYRTPCALWRPEHLARLQIDKNDPRRGELEIDTYATIWQITGEHWSNVSISLSTARPARQASPPLLSDDVIFLRRKTDDEKRNIYVEARDQSIASSGAERGARESDEMPGVDDGGAPLQFSPSAAVTLVSDGRPLRVQVSRSKMPCVVARVLYPERAGAAHLKATASLTSAPLLAGPILLTRGAAMVGRSKLPFVSTGDTVELGFGPDDGVRCRRVQNDQRDTIPVLGTQKLKRTVEVFLSNISGETKDLDVFERIPVSELEEIEIHTLDEGNFRFDKDGIGKQFIKLSANETKQLRLVYEVRASSKVRMPF